MWERNKESQRSVTTCCPKGEWKSKSKSRTFVQLDSVLLGGAELQVRKTLREWPRLPVLRRMESEVCLRERKKRRLVNVVVPSRVDGEGELSHRKQLFSSRLWSGGACWGWLRGGAIGGVWQERGRKGGRHAVVSASRVMYRVRVARVGTFLILWAACAVIARRARFSGATKGSQNCHAN